MRRAIYTGIKPEIEPQQSRVATFITDVLNGEVYAQVGFVNVLGVEIPSTALNQLANHTDVARISKDYGGQLDLDDTAKAIGADHLWNIGYDGDGVWDVAVVDSGVTINHPGLRSHKDGSAFYSKTAENYADDDYGHGTAVAGIIASTNSTYKGVGHGIDKIIICKVMDDGVPVSEIEVWDAVDWALDASRSPYPNNHETADIINLSLSWNSVSGYSDSAQFFDAIVHDLQVMVVKSAGNQGSLGITVPGEMYNGLTVANMDNRNSETRTDDVAWQTSSQGPANGRKKPDVIAPGKSIVTARSDYDNFNTPDYGTGTNLITFTGTSFAAPHVTGASAVLYDYIGGWPKEPKAVLINTADDWNNGWGADWDRKHGWGYINLETALTQWRTDSVGVNPAGGSLDAYFWSCTLDDGEKITAVWEREVDYGHIESGDANNPSTNPGVTDNGLNNLDLFLYDFTNDVKGTQLASSVSQVDNVEQVVYDGSNNRKVLVEVRNQTSSSTAHVTVAFPTTYTREGHGPFAPAAYRTSGENETVMDELGQNFPNPFNPDTWIPYSIAEEAPVSIQIFDASGKLVRHLNLGMKPAGRYFSKEKSAYWDGNNNLGEQIASGIYFYYLTAGDYAATRRMVVVE